MALISMVMRCLWINHLPSPRAGPSVLPPFQPQAANHDGVSPSGSHLGDNDDDQDTEDEESENESSKEQVELFGFDALYF